MSFAIEHPRFIHSLPIEAEDRPDRLRWLGLGVICTAMFISAMDMTIVNVALPDISDDLDAGIGELQWVIDGFLVALSGLLLVGSGLADRFGRRRVFLAGFLGFAVASLLAALANSALELIAARVLMGVAGACILPPALSLLAVLFPPELRPKAIGIWSAVAGIGLALGPVIGGVLVEVAGWQWVFLVNVPVVLAAAPLGLRWLPESRRPGVPPLDIVGALLSTVALGGVVFALIEGVDAGWTSPAVLTAIAVGLLAGIAFVALELRLSHPLFDVRVLRRRRVAAGAVAILACYIAALGMLFLIPQYLQYVQDRTALTTGLMMLPFGIGLGVAAPFGARLLAHHSARAILVAALLWATAGYVPLLLLGPDSTPLLVVLGMGMIGSGMGLGFPPATATIMDDLGLEKAGEGGATNQLARQVGGSLGVAIVGSVFAAVYAGRLGDSLEGLSSTTREQADDSIEGAKQVAGGLDGSAATQLLERAIDSFDTGARAGLWVCMAVLAIAVVWTWIGLAASRRPHDRAT